MRKTRVTALYHFAPRLFAGALPAIAALVGCSAAQSNDDLGIVHDKLVGCSVTLTASNASPTVGNRVAFTATATGCGTTPIYRFSVTTADSTTYTMRRDFARKNYFEWAPMVEGSYGVRVDVKDAYTLADADASVGQLTSYNVSPLLAAAPDCAIPDALEVRRNGQHHQVPRPLTSNTGHPLVTMLSVPDCDGSGNGDKITTQAWDVKASSWKDLETRRCASSHKSENFLVGGIRGDASNNVCLRYKVGNKTSAAVGATLGAIPSSIRIPITSSITTGHEDRAVTDSDLAVLMTTGRLTLQDKVDAAAGGACCDAAAACVGTSCCTDPSKGPAWQTVVQKQQNCWVSPIAVDVTDNKPLWYWSQTTLGSQNANDPNRAFQMAQYNGMRILAASEDTAHGIDNFAPSFLMTARNDEGRLRDVELLTANLFVQTDIAGNPLWETSTSAIEARLGPGQSFNGTQHDGLIAPNGDVVVLGYATHCGPHIGPGVGVSGTTHPCPPDANGNPQQKFLTDHIVVLDRNGSIKWHWDDYDHVDRNRRPRVPDSQNNFVSYPYCVANTGADIAACNAASGNTNLDPLTCMGPNAGECPQKFANMYSFANGMSLDRDGNLLISLRYQAQVVKVALNHPAADGDGSFVWKLGQCKDAPTDPDDPLCFKTGPEGARTQGMSPNWFSYQHNPTMMKDGTLVLFDNENVKCRTDFFSPTTQACLNGWTDCNASYTAWNATTCPFSSRGQVWKLHTKSHVANPILNHEFGPQIDVPNPLIGTPSTTTFGDRVGAVQKLSNGGWSFDIGGMTYGSTPPGASPFVAQVTELGCLDNADPCTLGTVRILKSNHLIYRSYRMPNLYLGISGVAERHGHNDGGDDDDDDDHDDVCQH